MNKDIEFEERLMLNKEQYEELMRLYSSSKDASIISQINYYFDDEDLSLRNAHKVLRIRVINNAKYELTMKIKGDNGDIELNNYLDKNTCDNIIQTLEFNNPSIEEEIKKVTNKNIKLITSLKTTRLEVKFPTHLLVIDVNYYNDVMDYDLEVEASSKDDALKYILEYASKYSLTYKKHYMSKSRRAINKALGIN